MGKLAGPVPFYTPKPLDFFHQLQRADYTFDRLVYLEFPNLALFFWLAMFLLIWLDSYLGCVNIAQKFQCLFELPLSYKQVVFAWFTNNNWLVMTGHGVCTEDVFWVFLVVYLLSLGMTFGILTFTFCYQNCFYFSFLKISWQMNMTFAAKFYDVWTY